MPRMRRSKENRYAEMSDWRVQYLENARRRVRSRRIRNMVAFALVLTAILAYLTGAVGSSISIAKDTLDSVHILLMGGEGFPQQTGIDTIYQVEELDGGFVVLGEEGCAVYSAAGSRTHSVQTGYARPAIAVGDKRFVLYNRSGNELRVESRTQELYVKSMENNIFLCAVSRNGWVAVATEDTRHAAALTVFSAEMEQMLRWNITSEQGIPLCMTFSDDGRRLAVAAMSTRDGQAVTNLYLLDTRRSGPLSIGSAEGCVPQLLRWNSSTELELVLDDSIRTYDISGGERSRYDFPDGQLVSLSADADGLALLFAVGQTGYAEILTHRFVCQYSGPVPTANRIVRAGRAFYLLNDRSVEKFNLGGGYEWTSTRETRPQALVQCGRLLLFAGNTAEELRNAAADENTRGK